VCASLNNFLYNHLFTFFMFIYALLLYVAWTVLCTTQKCELAPAKFWYNKWWWRLGVDVTIN
jgi:hypothetical protein